MNGANNTACVFRQHNVLFCQSGHHQEDIHTADLTDLGLGGALEQGRSLKRPQARLTRGRFVHP